MRRHKIEALVAAAIAAAVLLSLIVFAGPRFILLIPTIMGLWLVFFLPYWRRRSRRTARGAPRWELHSD